MRLQYLFRDPTHRQEIEEYNYKYEVVPTSGEKKGTVTRIISPRKEITNLNDNCWIVEFYFKSDDDEAARHLSKVHEEIIAFTPIILLNEASQYFTKRLYPFVNEFEVKLRKFLFLAFVQTNDDKLWKAVKTLDKDDFYTIYVRMFTSKSFNKSLDDLFNESHPAYTKEYILEKINDLDEDKTVWDTVIGSKLSLIKQSFHVIKSYRNDVMHAHYMDYDTYKKAISLFEEVNQQIDAEIDSIYHGYEPIQATSETMSAVDELLDKYGDIPVSEVKLMMKNFTPEIMNRIKEIVNSRTVICATGIEDYRECIHEIMEEIGAIAHCDAHDDYWYNTGK